MALLSMTGCATILRDSTQPIRVDTYTADGKMVSGADCSAINNKGVFYGKSGGPIQVHRSSKDLEVKCTLSEHDDATGRVISRTSGVVLGNLVFGGVIGLLIDHNQGTAYNYPSWINLVFGQLSVFDAAKEKKGMPNPAENNNLMKPSPHSSTSSDASTRPSTTLPKTAESKSP